MADQPPEPRNCPSTVSTPTPPPEKAAATVGPGVTTDQPHRPEDTAAVELPSIPGYELLSELGRGGMGVVYKARQLTLKRDVAVKVIRPERLEDARVVARFRQEMEAAARLLHPNIVTVFHADQVGSLHYLAMELIEGIDLGQFLARCGRLPVPQACGYIRQAADALQHAHERGLVHRDIKPSNLMIVCPPGAEPRPDARVKLLDLGLARPAQLSGDQASGQLTGDGVILGTLDYMAPEQADDPSRVDIRADLYSLGCTLYHLLTGQVPYPGGSVFQKVDRHRREEPRPVEALCPDVPAGIAAVVRRLMAKRPEDRYGTPAEFLAALEKPPETAKPPVLAPLTPEPPAPPTDWIAHRTWITSLDISRDGRLVASASVDWTARIWDISTGQLLRTLEHGAPVTAVVFSPDGTRVLTGGSDRSVRLWDVAARQEIRQYLGSTKALHAVQFSPDGRLVAAAGADKTVYAWETETGALKLRRGAHTDIVNTVAFSPDGQLLASGGHDGTVRVWELHGVQPVYEYPKRTGIIRKVVWSPDGRYLAFASDNAILVWHPETSALVARLIGNTNYVVSLAWSPDGRFFLSGGAGAIRLWSLAGAREVRQYRNASASMSCLVFSPDGAFALTAGHDRIIRRLEVGRDMTAAIAADERDAVRPSVGLSVPTGDEKSGELACFRGHTEPVTSVAFFAADRLVVSTSHDCTVRVWDVAAGRQRLLLLGHTDQIWKAVPTADGLHLLSVGQDGFIRLWDAATGREIERFPRQPKPINDIALSADQRLAVTGDDERLVRLWDVAAGRELARFEGHTDEVNGVAIAPDGRTVVSGGKDCTVRLWDVDGGKQTRVFGSWLGGRHQAPVRAVGFSPDGRTVVSAGRDGTIRRWDVDTGKELRRFQGHQDWPQAAVVSPDGRRVIAGCGGKTHTSFQAGKDNGVHVWDAASGEHLHRFDGHTGPVYGVAVSADGFTMASAGHDHTVRLWKLPE